MTYGTANRSQKGVIRMKSYELLFPVSQKSQYKFLLKQETGSGFQRHGSLANTIRFKEFGPDLEFVLV